MNKRDKLIKDNPEVPSAVYDIEESQEIADMYMSMDFSSDIINPCIDCGVEVDNLDNEVCDKCWQEWQETLKKLKAKL